jgi:DNA-binding MarR family transcriptional regulator
MKTFEADPEFLACRGCVCAKLRRASRAVTAHYERAFRGSGLRATQFTLLAVLTQTGPAAISKLAAEAGLERTTLTRNLGLLEAKGLVRVGSGGGDQRVRRVEMTRAGETAARKGLGAWRKAQVGVSAILGRYHLGNLADKVGR